MTDLELLAILAAIVYSGGDTHDGDAGYKPATAVAIAADLRNTASGYLLRLKAATKVQS